MTFATPLGLLALVSIPIIVAIHLFRRRFPERHIAGLFLWQAGRQVPQGGGRIDKLPITASLLLECLAALALSLILGGARLQTATSVPHLVVLLDDSASMSARVDDTETVRDRAVQRVRAEIERLGNRGRVTLIRSGERPTVLAGPMTYPAEALASLDRWAPSAPHHAFALGLRLARELAGESGRLLIVTDSTPAARGEPDVANAVWAAVGAARANVGILAAERVVTPEQGRGTVALTLGNYSDAAVQRRVTVRTAQAQVSASDVTLPPGVSSVRLAIPPGLPAVRVSLADDALHVDNEVTLVEPRSRLVAVEAHVAGERGREALARGLAALSQVTTAASGHLQFVDATALESPRAPGVWRVAFGAPSGPWRAPGAVQDFIGPYVLEKRHPLLLGVSLGGVVWAGAAPLASQRVRPIASAGDRVLVADVGGAGEAPAFLFNLDLDQTNLVRSPDWPILLSNIVEMRRQALPGPERWNYRVGEWIRIRLEHDPKAPLRLRTVTGERTLPASRSIEVTAPLVAGLVQLFEGDQTLFELGVNFLDETESDLRTRTSGDRGAFRDEARQEAEGGPASDPLFWILLSIVAAALLANWCVPGVERRLA